MLVVPHLQGARWELFREALKGATVASDTQGVEETVPRIFYLETGRGSPVCYESVVSALWS
jgi:hypothetical protein